MPPYVWLKQDRVVAVPTSQVEDRWPGRTPSGARSDALVCQAEFLATCADLFGVSLPADAGEDSFSMLPLLRGGNCGNRDSCIVHSWEGQFAIRKGRGKLLLWPGSGGWSPPTPAPSIWLDVPPADLSKLPPSQLYDLVADPAETTNVIADHPEIVTELGTLLPAQIESGRSTPGAAQPVDLSGWPQVWWRERFAP